MKLTFLGLACVIHRILCSEHNFAHTNVIFNGEGAHVPSISTLGTQAELDSPGLLMLPEGSSVYFVFTTFTDSPIPF